MEAWDFFTYLTHSEEDEKWQIVCTDVGRNRVQPHTEYPPNRSRHPSAFRNVDTGRILNEYQIVYITRGEGLLLSNSKQYTVRAGCMFLLFPGVLHKYQPNPDTGWDEWWVGFRGSLVDTLCRENVISARRPLFDIGLDDRLLAHLTYIFELVKKQEPFYQARAGATIIVLVAEIVSHRHRSTLQTRDREIVEEAKFTMEENIYGVVDLKGVSSRLSVSPSRLGTAFKAYTGMTPYQYFIQIKINKAKELLHTGHWSVKEIAFDLGFHDQYYFSRLFKKKTGMSPSQWANGRAS